MRKILVLLAAFALLGSACGSDDGNKNADTVDEGSGTASAPASGDDGGALEAKLLTVADLPAGFKQEESSDDDDESEEDSSTTGCEALDNLDDEEDLAEEEAEAEFARTDEEAETFSFVNEAIARYESEDDADEDFDKAVDAFNDCKSFSSTESDGTKITGALSALQFPRLGDDTLAVRMTATYEGEGQTITLEGSVVAVRSGNVTALLMNLNYGAGGLTAADFESIVRKAAAKL